MIVQFNSFKDAQGDWWVGVRVVNIDDMHEVLDYSEVYVGTFEDAQAYIAFTRAQRAA